MIRVMNMYQQLVNLGVSGYHIGKLAITDDYKLIEINDEKRQKDDENNVKLQE